MYGTGGRRASNVSVKSLSSIGHARSTCGYASTLIAGASSTSQSLKNARQAARYCSRWPFQRM